MKSSNKTTKFDYFLGIIGLSILAIMLDMAILGITPAELIADIQCYW